MCSMMYITYMKYADVPFTLSEVLADGESRMFFTRGDLSHTEFGGIFSFSGPNVTTEQTITVYAVVSAECCLPEVKIATIASFLVVLRA